MEENTEKNSEKKQEVVAPRKRIVGRWALFALRLFIAVRMFGIGLAKFVAIETIYDENGVPAMARNYAFENYQGVPADFVAKLVTDPLFPPWAIHWFSQMLGPMIIGMGLCVLLGVKLKWSLTILALIFAGLIFGLSLIVPDAQPPIFDLLAIVIALYLTEKIEKEKENL